MTAKKTRTSENRITLSRHDSPVGRLHLLSRGEVFCFIGFDTDRIQREIDQFLARNFSGYEIKQADGEHDKARRELDQYFSGGLRRFTLKLTLLGTQFQLQVWTALRTIPYGTTTTYKAVAAMLGNPESARAVGGALGRNPLPIVVPCHRVIGEKGALTGFGGGIERKKLLLQIEGVLLV